MNETEPKVLKVEGLTAFYGAAQTLFGVSFTVEEGEVVTLLGRNGMGKTTTISAIMGEMPDATGSVTFRGERLDGLPSYRVAQAGLGLVPEGRQIFPTLNVEENLVATAASRFGPGWRLKDIYEMFPSLAARRRSMGFQLSGGEQQMLAIGRGLMTNPRLLILDEATEGLAPLVRKDIWASLSRLKQEGLSILLVDKHIEALLKLADRHVVIEKGHVVWVGTSPALAASPEIQQRYLQV